MAYGLKFFSKESKLLNVVELLVLMSTFFEVKLGHFLSWDRVLSFDNLICMKYFMYHRIIESQNCMNW